MNVFYIDINLKCLFKIIHATSKRADIAPLDFFW
nr:MAG TPA: hypothetical protein [Caudoviricetes sp.]